MKKLATAVLAAAVGIAAPAYGADKDTNHAATAAGGKQAVQEPRQAQPAKKARKAKKDPHNSTKPMAPKTETKPAAAPSPSR